MNGIFRYMKELAARGTAYFIDILTLLKCLPLGADVMDTGRVGWEEPRDFGWWCSGGRFVRCPIQESGFLSVCKSAGNGRSKLEV